MTSDLLFFIKTEFEILKKTHPSAEILLVEKEIIALYLKFKRSGQSGGSAPYFASAISRDIEEGVSSDLIVEMVKSHDSLTFHFVKEINLLVERIKFFHIENLDALLRSIKDLILYNPISPLTGIDEEWCDVSEICNEREWYQNKRCSALFKFGKEGKPYYLDAIVMREQNGACWSGNAWLSQDDYESGDLDRMVGKRGYVKSFPFIPKTFYVDVRDMEVEGGDTEYFVVDLGQLKPIWDYYDKN